MSGANTDSDAPPGADAPERCDDEGCADSLPEPMEDSPPRGVGRWIGTSLVALYQNWLSPALPPSCRFRPTCSEYTRIAIRRYGLIRGGWMGLKRLAKCHPFHPGGHDPVP